MSRNTFPPPTDARSRVGAAVIKKKAGTASSADVDAAYQNLAASNIAAAIERALATAPQLSDDQVERLADLLRGVTP